MKGLPPQATEAMLEASRLLPEKIAALCRKEDCQLLLIAGDLFDGPYKKETFRTVRNVLGELGIPVVISPGNHDFCQPGSPYLEEEWPENVHIFKNPQVESIAFPELDCRIFGAGYTAMEHPGLPKNFCVSGDETWKIGLFHGDTTPGSVYFPIHRLSLFESGLHYAALGHIHKQGSLPTGSTLCRWPGAPMGRGFDETGEKGVLLVTLDDHARTQFLPLDTPRFYDFALDVGQDAQATLAAQLPADSCEDIYRVTLTGYSAPLDLPALQRTFSHIRHLLLRDETLPETDLWAGAGSDTLEGLLFGKLLELSGSESPVLVERAALAARICRSILDGQEVKLP